MVLEPETIPTLSSKNLESGYRSSEPMFERNLMKYTVLEDRVEIVSGPKTTQTPLAIITSALPEKASNAEYSDIAMGSSDYSLAKTHHDRSKKGKKHRKKQNKKNHQRNKKRKKIVKTTNQFEFF